MRVNINLATHPYEDARRFYLQWGSLLLALAVITAGLLSIALSAYSSSHAVARQVDQVRRQMAELDREAAAAKAILNRPENRDVAERSQLLNALIARKAFSWTQVFADLEKIVPPRVRIVSIRPDVNANHQLEIHLNAVGDSREKAVELMRRMEESPTFREAQVRSEREEPQGPNSGLEFEIVAQYVPQVRKGAP